MRQSDIVAEVSNDKQTLTALVEQDNAVKLGAFEQMQLSFDHLRPIVPKEN